MLPNAAALSARQLRRLLDPLVHRAVESTDADRYRKHFPAYAHVWMLLLHVLNGNGSLRQSHAQQATDPRLRSRLGMPDWISYSQLARSSTSRPSKCFEEILGGVLKEVQARPSSDPTWGLFGRVALLDATTISLSLKLSPWCRHKQHEPLVKLQTQLDLVRKIPDKLRLTLPDISDRGALSEWDLSDLAGWTLVFDLGYYGHRHFHRLMEADVNFITPLWPQAYYRVIRDLPVTDERSLRGDKVLLDEVIDLGSPNNRAGMVLKGMRLVTYKTTPGKRATGKLCKLITNRHDLSAVDLIRLYRARWQIELFFRWLKRQLGAISPLGYSRKAVWLTLILAVIVAILAWLTDAFRPRSVSRVSWLRALAPALVPTIYLSG